MGLNNRQASINQISMKIVFPFIVLLLLTGCINRIVTTYSSQESYLVSDSCNPRILVKKDLTGLKFNHLGSIMIDEPYTYLSKSTCSKEVAFKRLRADACNLNANIINIVSEINPGEEAPPYHRSACYRCIAVFHSLVIDSLSNKILEQEKREIILYEENSGLKWSDFSVNLPESYPQPYEFVSAVYYKAGKMSKWTGVFKNYTASAVYYSDISGVKKSFASEENEEIIKLLFDLTQVHAMKLKNFLNAHKPRIADTEKIKNIAREYSAGLKVDISNFNIETDFGNNAEAYQQWKDRIQLETKELGIKK